MTWLGLEFNPFIQQYELVQISDALYDGRAGLALFFASLFHCYPESEWRSCALGCLFEIRQKIYKKKVTELINSLGIGGFTGIGGIIYSFVHCGRLLEASVLIEEAKRLAIAIQEKHIQADHCYDILDGCAGLILALLKLNEIDPCTTLIALAMLCGEHLCACAEQMKEGLAWRNPNSDLHYTGFAHGTAGIAYSLLKLASYTGATAFLETAQKALEYERAHIFDKKYHWSFFLRTSEFVAWCDGTTGMGLGKLFSLPFIDDKRMMEEIKSAIYATENHLFEGSLDLCCGTLGRVEFLMEASSRLKISRLSYIAIETMQQVLVKVERRPKELCMPGLMRGASGIGYTFLRLQNQMSRLPQILLLD